MCHDWWTRREMRRQERLDEELRYLLDEERRSPTPPTPVVETEPDDERTDPERVTVEAGSSS
jgi:hypothetical protein